MEVSSPGPGSVLVSHNVLILVQALRGLGRLLFIICRGTAIPSPPLLVIDIVFGACGGFAAGLQDSLEACAQDLFVRGPHDWFTCLVVEGFRSEGEGMGNSLS